MASKKSRFGEALGNYSLAAIAGGLLLAVSNVLLVFVLPGVAALMTSLGGKALALIGALALVLVYLLKNVVRDAHDLETGLEIFAAILPFVISPVLGVVIGLYLEKFG
ncbi:MAG: hypothetical protein ABEJ75_03440 [Candidatus Nanohaloarchaea archaeon]